jgi:hypothetical protein
MSNDFTPKGGSNCREPMKVTEGVIFVGAVGEGGMTITLGGAIHELGVGGFGR